MSLDKDIKPEHLEQMKRLNQMLPFRIVYGAVNDKTKEFVVAAVATMHIPNRLARTGWTVYTIDRVKDARSRK